MPLLEASPVYKPFEYPWAHEYWQRQQRLRWSVGDVPLADDCRDWARQLGDHERNLATQIFRFATQASIDVQTCYQEQYGRTFKPTEVRMMLASFGDAETMHIAAHSHLLETIGMAESEYGAFLGYKEMRDKSDYLGTFSVDSDQDIARTLAMFGGFAEGLQLVSSTAMLMNFPRFGKMRGMGRIVSRSARDGALHCEGILRLFHAFCSERQCLTRAVREDIADICQKAVRLEDAFIDLAFEMGPVPGLSALEVKKYIRFLADVRLQQLGLQPIYLIGDNPLSWLQPLLAGAEEARPGDAPAALGSPLATRGNWAEVWESFDRRRLAQGPGAANDEGSAPDLLGGTGAAK